MKRLFFSLAILAIFGVLVSCTPSATIVNVEVVSAPDEVIVGDLDLSEFQIKISYSDDTFKYATFTVSMFSAEELAKFDVEGEQVISFSYQGIPGTITITITDLSSTMYTVVFKSGTEILKSEEVAEGESAAAPANPTKEGYTFKEWDKDFTNVTSNLEVNALFDVNTYTVTFKNGTETITTVTVNHGEGATAPANPTKEGYTFKEWDKAFTNVTSNLEVNAL
ncbi:MAG: InlB B-repeat-containing protein, partial [Bacilli bacterium]|nr:InlB B-repeat-containing protein [Bacilli bacterium]